MTPTQGTEATNVESEKLTLANIKQSPKVSQKGGGVFRITDFMTAKEKQELRESNFKGKSKRQFNDVDAFAGEVLGRFGYDAYMAWNRGEIPMTRMQKMILAERAREKRELLNLEAIIIAMVGSCIPTRKSRKEPKRKGPKIANKIFAAEEKQARGYN